MFNWGMWNMKHSWNDMLKCPMPIWSEHHVHNFPLVADPNLKENEYFITPDGKYTVPVWVWRRA